MDSILVVNKCGSFCNAGPIIVHIDNTCSGSRSGNIHHHDVRVSEHHIGTLSSHSQEVCGLKWSPDGKYLASGGNDNVLNVWSGQMTSSAQTAVQPVHTFSQHLAAVKVSEQRCFLQLHLIKLLV